MKREQEREEGGEGEMRIREGRGDREERGEGGE